MTVARFVHTIYCDDIRYEIGGKLSLIGCYSSDLIVPRQPQAIVLPKLCAQVNVVTPIDSPFELLTLKAYRNDELLAEMEVPGIGQSKPDDALLGNAVPARWSKVSALMTFSPFEVGEQDGSLRIDAVTESATIRGMGLRLVIRDPHDITGGSIPPGAEHAR